MDRVLSEQHIVGRGRRSRSRDEARRDSRGAGSERRETLHRARRRIRCERTGFRVNGVRVKTLALGALAIGLAGGLVMLLPLLEGADLSGEIVGPEITRAVIDPYLYPGSAAQVELELTEDLYYEVNQGETLSEIANQFDVEVAALAAHNDIADPDSVTAGQTLRIPPPAM